MHESACTNSRIACSGMQFEPTWFIIDMHRLFMCFSLLFVLCMLVSWSGRVQLKGGALAGD